MHEKLGEDGFDHRHLEDLYSFIDNNKNTNSLTESIADMEKALAYLLKTQTEVLRKNADQWSSEESSKFIKHIEHTLRKIILKEIVMILLMEDKEHKDKQCKCKDDDDRCKEKHCKDEEHHHDCKKDPCKDEKHHHDCKKDDNTCKDNKKDKKKHHQKCKCHDGDKQNHKCEKCSHCHKKCSCSCKTYECRECCKKHKHCRCFSW